MYVRPGLYLGAAQKPLSEERSSRGNDSEGRMKVVLLGPKLLKKYLKIGPFPLKNNETP